MDDEQMSMLFRNQVKVVAPVYDIKGRFIRVRSSLSDFDLVRVFGRVPDNISPGDWVCCFGAVLSNGIVAHTIEKVDFTPDHLHVGQQRFTDE